MNTALNFLCLLEQLTLIPAVDPGFPRGGGGAPTYDFAKFSRKLHEIERIWAPGGGGGGGRPSRPH